LSSYFPLSLTREEKPECLIRNFSAVNVRMRFSKLINLLQ